MTHPVPSAYRVLTGPDDARFCQRVTEALQQGWALYGSPSLTFDGTHVVVAQAIVWTESTPPSGGRA